MRLNPGLGFCVAAFLTIDLNFAALKASADALDQPLRSNRTGETLSCAVCHADGKTVTGGPSRKGARRADPLWIAALIDAVSEDSILSGVDASDRDEDGISGRVMWVLSLRDQRAMPGRFGWKASVGTLEDQIANALVADMGVANGLLTYRDQTCSSEDRGCLIPARMSSSADESVDRVAIIDFAAAVRDRFKPLPSPDAEGLALFRETGCATCHVPFQQTQTGHAIPLFSDLLLHDMGPHLAEAKTVGAAWPTEWRTPSLLGLSEKTGLLHHGRAATIAQAVEAHGGEAQASAVAFLALSEDKVLDLVTFLNGL